MVATPERAPDYAGSGLLLSARGLTKTYGGQCVVDGIDLDIPERAFTTFLGPSGCGKTTILRMIAGFETPDAGSIVLDGRSLSGVPPERRPVNTVFQSYALFPHLTVLDNVAFSLTLRRQSNIDVAARVKRALDAVHMTAFGDRYPHQLSGGQQQRIAVARAIIAEPHLLLLDEPLSALDKKMRGHLQIELKDLQRRLGIAFVYVTHDQEEAFALSDIVVVMNKGRIVQKAPPLTIYARPANAFVADFIGAATLLPGDIVAGEGANGSAAIDTAIGIVECPAVEGLAKGDRAVLAIRPEHVRIGTDGLSAVIRHVVFKGDRYLVEAEVNGFILQFLADNPLTPGTTVGLIVDRDRAFITRIG
ncbi:ABC-type Fe3+/spermidine/putrescine transport system ATPase subunit [Rhizobium sp. PP-F2F-G48]|uniref:ABC transporter ATP-binding protein n=1 Tax=Rhizobium sp. PP-F2F-G48 TaxID=2135651 RepID=UPI00104A18B9|nr:ABC transporter ATP-binding protein [Rhizobium sp. PP-F2F-G48]TCM50819.1 ABC-type Fe3+/spermidine/putrescine transport system ATPase subunit [Rhizobium sp. PP-F2F-G48]